jgi:anti-sigma factor RsiW
MTCEEAAAVAGWFLDTEEDSHTMVGLHVASCPSCARLVARRRGWRRVVRQAPRFEPDQAGLASRLREAIATTPLPNILPPVGASPVTFGAPLPAVERPVVAPRSPMVRRSVMVAAWSFSAAAVLLCGFLTLWMWTIMRHVESVDRDLVARDVVASHIRSMMGQHLTDVPSSDHHTVKPWFAGKVPYSIAVPDLGAEAFTLDGGRLDYLAGRPVAALVYRRRQHVINVFAWPLTADDRAETGTHSQAGYEAIAWSARGQQYWAVSDLNDAELHQFISLFQRSE